MEKETFILQTTRAGRLPTNAVFTDEAVARVETDRAQKSGAFDHIKLIHMIGSGKKVLIENGSPPSAKDIAARTKAAKTEPARAKKKQVTTAQLISRVTWLVTLLLIGGVLFYAFEYFKTK
jgi:hypothetical protein